MDREGTTGSKWFWWIMGIVATVVAAAIITALHLNSSSARTTPVAQVTTLPAQVTTPPAQVTTPPAQVTTPPAQVTTPPAQVTTDYSGTYDGQALNGGAVGNVQLQVNEIDATSGATTAHVTWSGALVGEGPLRGAFNANNATFEGEIASPEGPWNVEMYCTFSDSGNVTCNYQLQAVAPNYYGPQQGSLSANK